MNLDADNIKLPTLKINSSPFLKENKVYKIQDYTLTNEGLFYNSIDKQSGQVNQIKISDGVYVAKVVHNIDDNDTYINITYKFNNKDITIKCPIVFYT